MDQASKQAIAILNKIVDKIDANLIDEWRYAQECEQRERCSADLRVLEELKLMIRGYITHE